MMLDFRILPMYDDMEKAFRYDPRGRGGLLLFPLSVFTVSVSSGILYSSFTGGEVDNPFAANMLLIISTVAVLFVIGLKKWSIKKMDAKFENWLKEKHELIAPEGFRLGERNSKKFTSSVTGEPVYMDVFSYPVYLEKSFLGFRYSVRYRTVELERIPAAPRFKV